MQIRLSPIALIFWIGAEIVTYGLFIQRYGIASALLVGITSLGLGLFVLKRIGIRLSALAGAGPWQGDMLWIRLKSVGWAGVGAALLIVPGFLTNLAGATLVVLNPGAWLGRVPESKEQGADILDLDRGDWSTNADTVHDRPSIGQDRSN